MGRHRWLRHSYGHGRCRLHDSSGNVATVEPCRIRASGVIKYGWMMATGEEKEVGGQAWLAR